VKLSLCCFSSEHQVMKPYWGSGGIAPRILNLGTLMEVSGQLHASAALLPGKESLVPIGWEAWWAPQPVWTRWWREKFQPPTGTRTPDHAARSPALYLRRSVL